MQDTEAKKIILELAKVERADVVDAKNYLAGLNGEIVVRDEAKKRADQVVGPPEGEMPLWQENPTPTLTQFARHVSVQLAVFKAAWELVSAGIMLPAAQTSTWAPPVGWTTVRPGSGGYRSGEELKELLASYPEKLIRPSWLKDKTLLSDGDLYLLTLDATGLHQGIKDALGQAVRCFAAGLHVPTVAMLDAASEGAWVEAGMALTRKAPTDAAGAKLSTTLGDPGKSVRTKMAAVCSYFESRKDLQSACGIAPAQLRETLQWSGLVRDARNVLHWNVSATIPNDYTTVSTLMLAALNHIKRLHVLAS